MVVEGGKIIPNTSFRKLSPLVAVFAVFLIGFIGHDAYATTYDIKDQPSCLSIPSGSPSWNPIKNICTVTGINLVLNSGDSFSIETGTNFIVNSGTILYNPGTTISNYGILNDSGLINNAGIINNHKVLNINPGGKIFNAYDSTGENIINNFGTFNNYGTFDTDCTGYVNNYGVFNNNLHAAIGTCSSGSINNLSGGVFNNSGYIINNQVFNNSGIFNINPSGFLSIEDLEAVVINNGTINNSGIIENVAQAQGIKNNGTLNNNCPGVIRNTVPITGNPIVKVCHASSTKILPNPAEMKIGTRITLHATVLDLNSGTKITPNGTIFWSDLAAGGSFNSTSCMLSHYTISESKCSITYTPSSVGLITINETYSGDSNHKTSSGLSSLTVNPRNTTTGIIPVPVDGKYPVGIPRSFQAFVYDADVGKKTIPQGTISWTDNGAGGTLSNSTCTLNMATPDRSQCIVSYTPSKKGLITLNATYSGDSTHKTSFGYHSILTNLLVVSLTPNKDSFVAQLSNNTNLGANQTLFVSQGSHKRTLLSFDLSPFETKQVSSALLQLYITTNGNNWGGITNTNGIQIHKLLTDWTEGNGTSKINRGTGSGVTWNCSTDNNIANQLADCVSVWNGGKFAGTTATKLITNSMVNQWIAFNVTNDVNSFLDGNPADNYGWLIKKANETSSGSVGFASKEDTNSSLVPRLVLTFK